MKTLGQTREEVLNIERAVSITNNLKGDIAEVGVYAGDTAKIIETRNESRNIYLFDTFSGLQDCSPKDGGYLRNGFFSPFDSASCPNSYEQVKQKFQRNSKVTLIRGYFPESGEEILSGKIFSFVHLDVDTYQSTLNSLEYFYPKTEKGGYFIVHDYTDNPQVEGVKCAVDEFFSDKEDAVNTGGVNSTQAIILKSDSPNSWGRGFR